MQNDEFRENVRQDVSRMTVSEMTRLHDGLKRRNQENPIAQTLIEVLSEEIEKRPQPENDDDMVVD